MATQTSEGTGNGSVENLFPKIVNGKVNIDNLTDSTASINTVNLENNFSLDIEGLSGDEWTNVDGFDLELPSAGTYLIIYHISSLLAADPTTDTMYMSARLVKRIDNGESIESEGITNGNTLVNYVEFPEAGENYVNCHTHVLPYVATGADTLSIDALYHGSNLTDRIFMGNGEGSYAQYGHSYISYYKIGN